MAKIIISAEAQAVLADIKQRIKTVTDDHIREHINAKLFKDFDVFINHFKYDDSRAWLEACQNAEQRLESVGA